MHCISVYICADDGSFNETPHLKLPQDYVLFTEKPKGLKKNRLVAYVETDYFGGGGDQYSRVWNCKENVFNCNQYDAIDQALILIGVNRDNDKDEFDTIGLGKFRSNHEINQLIYDRI